jgi:excisionase family DNA binding protein
MAEDIRGGIELSAIEKLLYRPEEVTGILGLSRASVGTLIRSGHLRSVTVGRLRLIPKDAIAEFVAGLDEGQRTPYGWRGGSAAAPRGRSDA